MHPQWPIFAILGETTSANIRKHERTSAGYRDLGLYVEFARIRRQRRLAMRYAVASSPRRLRAFYSADARTYVCVCTHVYARESQWSSLLIRSDISVPSGETATTQPLTDLNNGSPYRFPIFLSPIAACARCTLENVVVVIVVAFVA